MSKRGISQIQGKIEIKLGEEVFYEVSRIHQMEDHSKVKNALWKLYVRELGNWRELKQSPSSPPKRGDRVSFVIRNQKLVGKELLVESYIYKPEMKSPPGLIVKVLGGDEKKIYSVELFMVDDTPISKEKILKYNQTIKVKVHTKNMPKEFLKLSLYEDDAKGEGDNFKNEQNKVSEITKRTNEKGFLWHEFRLNADFSKIANAVLDGTSDQHHEYYILVESAENGSKTSRNINVENPTYNKVYEGGTIEEVVLVRKYKEQIGVDPTPKTGKSASKVGGK